jgi:hypothetical protein
MGADRRTVPVGVALFGPVWRPGALVQAVDSSRQEGIDALRGLHITDHQMRLYMNYRLTLSPEAAAAKTGFSNPKRARIGSRTICACHRRRRCRVAGDGQISSRPIAQVLHTKP